MSIDSKPSEPAPAPKRTTEQRLSDLEAEVKALKELVSKGKR